MNGDVMDFIRQFREEMRNTYATKVELMAFREETAINFGKVNEAIMGTHVEIAKSHADLSTKIANAHVKIAELEVRMGAQETRIIKWFVATAITLTGVVFAIARLVH